MAPDAGDAEKKSVRELPSILKYLFLLAAAFALGFMLFNFVVIPAITRRTEVVRAPMLEGLSLKQAQDMCSRQKLELVVAGRRNSDEVPADYIIAQIPRRGASLKAGRTIKVIVSEGKRLEMVPDLRGKSQREAELILESLGLVAGRTLNIIVPGAGQPRVVASSPSAGTRIPRGARVDLLVGVKGDSRSYMMPDLVGKDFPFSRDRLEKMGFNVVYRTTRSVEGTFPNTIVSQKPLPGSKIEEGETIELVVSASD